MNTSDRKFTFYYLHRLTVRTAAVLFITGFILWPMNNWAIGLKEKSEITRKTHATQTISMEVFKKSFSPNKFTLRKGVPVRWVIDVKELSECNESIVVPQYDLEIRLQPGKQVVEFTPPESGVVPWSCWMGMIPGTFVIVDDDGSEHP